MAKKYPKEETLQRLKYWCDLQERCHQEVRNKLISWGWYWDEGEELIAELISMNYLNEQRFAEAYVSGKYRIKKWGRDKIVQNLKMKKISDFCIRKGLEEIDEEEYLANLRYLIERKKNDYKEKNAFKLKGKIASYLRTKGYESGLIWEELGGLD